MSWTVRAGLPLALGVACFLGLSRVSPAVSKNLPVGRTGAPGDPGTCMAAGCHAGTDHEQSDGIVLSVPNRMTYTPGAAKQTWTLSIEDDLLVQGFQLTARSGASFQQQAGAFSTSTPAGPVEVRCGDGTVKSAACPTSSPVEYVQHSEATGVTTFRFDWQPPAANVGDIRVWVAAIRKGADRVRQHRKVFTIRPEPAALPAPAIRPGGIGESFTGTAGTSNQTWLSIYGDNLAQGTKTWDNSIFGNVLPTQLNGVRVLLNGRALPLNFVSPGQINALGNTVLTAGNDVVAVVTDGGTTANATFVRRPLAPAFYCARRAGDSRFYAVGVAPDGTYVGTVGTDPRVTRAARPGEVVLLFGTGFGPTNPPVPAGVVPGAPAALQRPLTITLEGKTLEQVGPGYLIAPGLYQFNVKIPADAPAGTLALKAAVEQFSSAADVYLSVAP